MKKISSLIAGGAVVCLSLLSTHVSAQTTYLSEGTMDVVSGNTPVCNDGTYSLANNYLRVFKISDYITCNNFRVDSIKFGIDQAASVNGSQPLAINIYQLAASSPLTYANLIFMDTYSGLLPDATSAEIITIPFSANLLGNNSLVVEIVSPDGTNDHIFLMGSNTAAQTKPSYMIAPTCSINDITNMTTVNTAPISLAISAYGHPVEVPMPDTFTTGKSMVCNGEVVTYTVPTSFTPDYYDWSYSGTGVTVNAAYNTASLSFSPTATSGTLSVTATSGGIVSPPRTLNITATPIPAPTISRGGNVLTSSVSNGCTWYKDNIAITGANSSTYTMTANGSYFVKVTQNGCSGSSDTVQIADIVPTAIGNVDAKKLGLVLSPNPTSSLLNIQCNVPVNATVFSAEGKQLLFTKNAKTIDMSAFNAGIYYILFTDKDGSQLTREKFVKL